MVTEITKNTLKAELVDNGFSYEYGSKTCYQEEKEWQFSGEIKVKYTGTFDEGEGDSVDSDEVIEYIKLNIHHDLKNENLLPEYDKEVLTLILSSNYKVINKKQNSDDFEVEFLLELNN